MNQKKKKRIFANDVAIANMTKKKLEKNQKNVVQHRHCLKHLRAKQDKKRNEKSPMESNDPTLSDKTSTLLPPPSTWPALYRSYFGMHRLYN